MKILKPFYSCLFVILYTILLTSSCKKEEPNLAPYNVILYLPSNAATELTLSDSLSWHRVTDPEGDAVSYDVYLGTDANPELVSTNQTGTTFIPLLSSATTYYWKVIAKDGNGGISQSDVWSFTTLNVPPGEFFLLNPENQGFVDSDFCLLEWQESIDHEGGLITYDVYLRDESSSSFTLISSDQDSTSLWAPSLIVFADYYWKVVAKDQAGNTTESAVWSFFVEIK